jgi:hypothetical protein
VLVSSTCDCIEDSTTGLFVPGQSNAGPISGVPTGAPLGSNGERDTIPGRRASRRTERWSLKELQRSYTEAASAQACGYPIGPVTVEISEAFIAHVTGVAHCGSPWACPICAPVIREQVAREYNEMATIATALGWSLLFVVGTHRHHLGDRLAESLPMVTSACHDTLKGRWWDGFKRRHHYAGMLRTVEINYGWRHGWHDHWQSLMFFRGQVEDEEVQALRDWWFSRWDRVCTAQGYGPLVAEGLDVSRLREEDRIGEYLVKPAGNWGIGRELTRGDLKSGLETFPAFDLLSPATKGLWCEYESATKGRRFRMASKGLRAELLGSVPEKSDEELAAAEGSGPVLFVVHVDGQEWSWYVQAGLVGWYLENLELFSRLFVWMARTVGHVVDPVEWKRSERIDWKNSQSLRKRTEVVELRSVSNG